MKYGLAASIWTNSSAEGIMKFALSLYLKIEILEYNILRCERGHDLGKLVVAPRSKVVPMVCDWQK